MSVSFNIFAISLEPACIITIYQQYMLAHICHAYMSMYAYAFTWAACIEMGPTQTFEGNEEWFPASSLLIHSDHFWQPGPILAAKSGPGSDHFWLDQKWSTRTTSRPDHFSRDSLMASRVLGY